MSHYLKTTMDCIFGEGNFRNEVIWGYRTQGVAMRWWPRKHDVLLFYVNGKDWTFKPQQERQFYNKPFRHTQIDERGRYYVDSYLRDVWDHDVTKPSISQSPERTGYPTQKPLALLERIIKASSNIGDLVLDPFCGCATTCVAAEKVGRQWLGIDVSAKAYELVQMRLSKEVERPDALPPWRNEVHFDTRIPRRTDLGKNYRESKFVYIISNPKYDGQYKVGIAKNLDQRLNSYQIGDPDRSYALKYSILATNFRETEKHIHRVFPNQHEWVTAPLKEIRREIEAYAEAA